MAKSIDELHQEFGLRESDLTEVITGIIPEWAMPAPVLKQYQDYEGADESYDNSELAVIQATTTYRQARGKDVAAIRDAVVSGKKVPGYANEAKAEDDLKGALTARRVVAQIRQQEARKLVSLMREHRGEIHAAMEQRVNAVTPKIRDVLNEFEAKLQPLYEELAEALTPVELLRTLDTRQSEDIGAAMRHVSRPDIMGSRNNLRTYEQMVEDLASSAEPTRIRLKDPHGHISEHDLFGNTEQITQSLQMHIETLKKAGWTEVPWD